MAPVFRLRQPSTRVVRRKPIPPPVVETVAAVVVAVPEAATCPPAPTLEAIPPSLLSMPIPPSEPQLQAELGMDELGRMVQQAARRAARTLAISEKIQEAGRIAHPFSPEQEQFYAERTHAYLRKVMEITDKGAIGMLAVLE